MASIFISHSSRDDGFVRDLQQALGLHGVSAWTDSRELKPGGLLDPDIAKAIDEAAGCVVVVSPDALQSKWVGKELRRALDVQQRRGRDKFPVIPLSLDDTKLGVLEEFFGVEPLYVPARSGAGGTDAALDEILVALGKRLPADVAPAEQPAEEPLEELVLELTDLTFREQDGVRRASARARLVYEPAAAGQREVVSERSWRFVAPLGPIETEELRWYLEKYAVWPSEIFRARAQRIEARLVEWGRLLYDAAIPGAHAANVLQAWAGVDERADRRCSVLVDTELEAGAPDDEVQRAREAASLLLGLPWELLHDGGGFLFQGAQPTRVRRRLPNRRALDISVVATPIRILLLSPRPEDEACGYIDHRSSALPLVEATEALGGLVHIHVLAAPTLPALRDELDRARAASRPYHVVHFDGHGAYDHAVGLGALCFEDPRDLERPEQRRHVTVHTDVLGPLLRDHRIPLVFLDACQTATAEQASESVASELLKVGVASVVAMSHNVLVETARRFVEAFYDSLARGDRVGDAMLVGQRTLADDTFRGRVFGAGELRLEDWFVPVLFQEKDDPQLFRTTTSRRTQDDLRAALDARLGALPGEPETGFVGRSRQLLALQRLLHDERYVVVRGQGGEGKTALAAELGRWMVRSHQVRRAAFVSVETHSTALAVLDAIGRQLVTSYTVATYDDLEDALLPIERALVEQSTLLVVDNMESVLLPPYVESPEALSASAREELDAILGLCARLVAAGDTRLVFTSREALPAPFDGARNRRELHRLDRQEAVQLIERVLNREGAGAAADAARESIERLADAVHGHARTLALLAPSLRSVGADATRESLVALMAEMARTFPDSREHSLFASIELSLRRLSPADRERAQVLAVFHGAVDLDLLRIMTGWEAADVAGFGGALVGTGMATPDRFNHLTLNPALCPYLRTQIDPAAVGALTARWMAAMTMYVQFLKQQRRENGEIAAALTVLELPNLLAFLDRARTGSDPAEIIELATSLYTLFQTLGKRRLLDRVAEVRDAAAATLGDAWNHAVFEARRTRIEQMLSTGRLPEALDAAQRLLEHTTAAGPDAYPSAAYDIALVMALYARILRNTGRAELALPLLADAQARFEAQANGEGSVAAATMASMCLTERGDCLQALGRLDEAATVYEESMRRDEARGAVRDVAVDKAQLASVRLQQRRLAESLAAYQEARDIFVRLEEPGSVAVIWHQIGMVYALGGEPDAAEDAYRRSLALKVQLGDVAGQASTLSQLGALYSDVRRRPEDAVAFYQQAVDIRVGLRDVAGEGRARYNLAAALRPLRRHDDARREVLRAVECDRQSGHAAEPWKTWALLEEIEAEAGDRDAALAARRRAVSAYLAYRRDGGENYYNDGRLALAVTEPLLAGDDVTAVAMLDQLLAEPDLAPWVRPFGLALRAVIGGNRDASLADTPGLDHTMAAEVLFLMERLDGRR